MSSVGIRLKEERERLGYNQTDFASAGGVKKQAQINYESGKRMPDTSYLEGVAAVGADVQYIVTGSKCAHVRVFDRNDKTLELVEECAAALRIIERKLNLSLNDDKFGLIVRMLFEEYYDEFVGSDDDDAPAEGGGIDTAKVVQLVKLAS